MSAPDDFANKDGYAYFDMSREYVHQDDFFIIFIFLFYFFIFLFFPSFLSSLPFHVDDEKRSWRIDLTKTIRRKEIGSLSVRYVAVVNRCYQRVQRMSHTEKIKLNPFFDFFKHFFLRPIPGVMDRPKKVFSNP